MTATGLNDIYQKLIAHGMPERGGLEMDLYTAEDLVTRPVWYLWGDSLQDQEAADLITMHAVRWYMSLPDNICREVQFQSDGEVFVIGPPSKTAQVQDTPEMVVRDNALAAILAALEGEK